MRAGGVKAALIANEKTEGVLVDSNKLDSELSQHVKSPVILQLLCSLVRGLVYSLGRGLFFDLAVAASNKILPQFFQKLNNGGVVQFI